MQLRISKKAIIRAINYYYTRLFIIIVSQVNVISQ
jgi:hypothetical protein